MWDPFSSAKITSVTCLSVEISNKPSGCEVASHVRFILFDLNFNKEAYRRINSSLRGYLLWLKIMLPSLCLSSTNLLNLVGKDDSSVISSKSFAFFGRSRNVLSPSRIKSSAWFFGRLFQNAVGYMIEDGRIVFQEFHAHVSLVMHIEVVCHRSSASHRPYSGFRSFRHWSGESSNTRATFLWMIPFWETPNLADILGGYSPHFQTATCCQCQK